MFLMLAVFAAQAQELSVCTYNLRYKNSSDTDAGNGWNTRRTYLINFVNFQQPDLLGVQEALKAQMDDMANGLKGYAYIGVGRNDGKTSGEYSAIFYRKERMVLLDYGNFWLSDTPNTPSKGFPSKGGSTSYYRICTWGKFYDKISGSVVYHFNTHMDLDETNRQQSYYLIKQKIEEIASKTAPVMVTGDYNAVQTGGAYKLFYNSGFLYDCYHRSSQKFMTNGTCPGFNAGTYSTVDGELRRIDHIFVTRAFNVKHYGVLNPCYYSTSGTSTYYERAYSDHSPVIAKLIIRTPELPDISETLPPIVDGKYQISSADELKGFACIVNGLSIFQDAAAKGVLTSDIDMSGMTSWTAIGTNASPFTGTFDGQGHKITNFGTRNEEGNSYTLQFSGGKQGLFGYAKNATIKNFSISGAFTYNGGNGYGVVGWAAGCTLSDIHSSLDIASASATSHVGGVCGSLREGTSAIRCSFSGTITDSHGSHDCIGGIGGYSNENCRYENCANYGTITFSNADAYASGICGYVNSDAFIGLYNCLNVGAVKTANGTAPTYGGALVGWLRAHANATFENNYWLAGSAACAYGGNEADATAVNAQQLASGEVCHKLNHGSASEEEANSYQATINWYQTLPSTDATVEPDPYPVLDDTHLRVWRYGSTYTNDDPDGIALPHESYETYKSYKTYMSYKTYNISGQMVSSPSQKGIYIINGKKYLK